jgi:DNA end-binding protein Ku
MAPRANWKGYLRLSLVSCPIALHPASSLSEKVSFNRINGKTGNRLKAECRFGDRRGRLAGGHGARL